MQEVKRLFFDAAAEFAYWVHIPIRAAYHWSLDLIIYLDEKAEEYRVQ
jgi:hypothetical protein